MQKRLVLASLQQRVLTVILSCLQIWEQLTHPKHFSRTCRRLHNFSTYVSFRARWFLARYLPYEVIFEAIARTKIFSAALFHRLLRGRAVLARNLVQLLYILHAPSSFSGPRSTQWGGISFDAYLEVMTEGRRLVSMRFDSAVRALSPFSRHRAHTSLRSTATSALRSENSTALSSRGVRIVADPMRRVSALTSSSCADLNLPAPSRVDKLVRLFEQNRFLPLNLSFTLLQDRSGVHLKVSQRSSRADIRKALVKYPILARTAHSNGE